jgi:hypothetical protein
MKQALGLKHVDGLSALAAALVERLMGLAAGPELRVSYAIAQAATRARRRRAAKPMAQSDSALQMQERSGEW